jgi:hypothetical protein
MAGGSVLFGPQLVSDPLAAAPEPPAAVPAPAAAPLVPVVVVVPVAPLPAVVLGVPAVPLLPAALPVAAVGVTDVLPEFAPTPGPSVLLLQPTPTTALSNKEVDTLARYERSKCSFMKTTFAFGRLLD